MNTASASAEEPRWLTDEEQRTWRAYMNAATLLEDHLDRQLQRDAGMPHVYYGLLVQLVEAPRRRLRMTELAMNAKITRSRLSHAIARLEKNGWVRREDCPSDKRGQFAVLTDAGYEVLSKAAPGHVEAGLLRPDHARTAQSPRRGHADHRRGAAAEGRGRGPALAALTD
jgi:DNA-binding MarR family transcriptional regulator